MNVWFVVKSSWRWRSYAEQQVSIREKGNKAREALKTAKSIECFEWTEATIKIYIKFEYESKTKHECSINIYCMVSVQIWQKYFFFFKNHTNQASK